MVMHLKSDFLFIHFFLPPGGSPEREIMKCSLCVRACVGACVGVPVYAFKLRTWVGLHTF